MHTLADVRLALRALAKNRSFAAAALVTIALGVGANAAVFSVVNATLIQPLPYADPERLVALFETARRPAVERRAVSYLNFRDWQREARSFEAMSVMTGTRFTIATTGQPERRVGVLVSGGFFDVLGVRPVLGRGLTGRDDAPGATPVVVISEALWQGMFGGDPQVVGRGLTIDSTPSTVVGVVSGFGETVGDPVVWAPIRRFAGADLLDDRGQRSIDRVVARLAPGVTLEQAQAEMDALAARIDRMYPSAVAERGAGIRPLRDEFFGGPLRGMLLVLLGAVGFVLLIACVNVAGLLLARGSTRQGELALRSALGASRGRIVRQLLTESVVVSVLGGAVGLLAASWAVDLLVAMSPVSFPGFVRIGIDLPVLVFTFAVCLATGVVSGLVPAMTASRTELASPLNIVRRDGGSSTMVRGSLVTAEIALAMVLLIGAGLLLRTLDRLMALDPGFRPDGLVTVRLTVPAPDASGDVAPERLTAFSRTLLAQVRALPGVTAASLSSDVPLGTSVSATNVRIDGGDDTAIRVYRHLVSPGHFRTIGVPLLAGRDFTDDDARTAGDGVVIVSQAMANRHWPAGDALHQRIRGPRDSVSPIWRGDRRFEIVGIVADLQHRQLREPDSADPDIFLPLYQAPAPAFAVLARTSVDAQPVAAAIRTTIAELDASVPVFQIETGDQLIARQTAGVRFSGTLLTVFALVALSLTIVGIYGVTAYAVSRQTRQLGIRMALGATRWNVLRLVLSSGIALVGAGLALGTLAALALTRVLAAGLYGVSATDPVTFAAVIGLLAVVGVLACLVPAAKATRIDPCVALRAD